MDTIDKTDQLLLKHFFDNTHQHIQDNGFTQRVMNRLPIRTARLRAWSRSLNTLAIVGSIALLIYFGFFDQISQFLIQCSHRILIAFITFDLESLLVRIILFLHRLPHFLPSPAQLLTLLIALSVLMFLGLQRIFKSI